MTIYFLFLSQEKRIQIIGIYRFAESYLRSWFPKLISYEVLNNRLNRLNEAFKLLITFLLQDHKHIDCIFLVSLLDSLPIIKTHDKHFGKVTPELTDTGFCSTKSMYYHCVMLYSLGYYRLDQLPFLGKLLITLASANDLNAFRSALREIEKRICYGDKIHLNTKYFNHLAQSQNPIMHTSIKTVKNQTDWEKKIYMATNHLVIEAVFSVRQPIESLFNCMIANTIFQRENKFRYANDFLIHVFDRLAAAYIFWIFTLDLFY
jgi:hypothetical protein